MLIEEGYLDPEWKLAIPEVSVFDIETLESPCELGMEHRLVSIALASEIDKQSHYWVIDKSTEIERQRIGKFNLKRYNKIFFS